jgi:hypothetical protein
VVGLLEHPDKGLEVHTGLVIRNILADLAEENTAKVSLHMVVRTQVAVMVVYKALRKAVARTVLAGLMIDMVHQKEHFLAALDYLLNMDFEDIGSMVFDHSCLSFPFPRKSIYT